MDVGRYLPLALPRRTARLFGSYWVPLLAWYLAGVGLHDVFAELAARVNLYSSVAAYSLLALGILCQLAAYAVMFLVLQPGLPTVWRLRGPGRRTFRELLGAVGLALLPFLVVYSAWDLFRDDLDTLQYRTWLLYGSELGWPTSYLPAEFTGWVALAGVAAWLLARVCELVTRRTQNPVSGVLAAVFEANWMCFAVFGVMMLVGALGDWLRLTVAFQHLVELRELVTVVTPALPVPLDELVRLASFDLGWLDGYQVTVKNAVALPLAWLAIAGACYGRELAGVRPVAGLDDRIDPTAPALKRLALRFPPQGVREKYYPPLHAIQLVGFTGLPAVLLFCVCYGGIDLCGRLLTQAVATVIGPHSPGEFWVGPEVLVAGAVRAVTEILRICLLAATFDLALAVFRSRTAAPAGTAPATSPHGTR